MIVRRKKPKDLYLIHQAISPIHLADWKLEKQWVERVSISQLISPVFPKDFTVRMRYTHAPIQTRFGGILRKNILENNLNTWKPQLDVVLQRLRLLKIPHVAHINAGWELSAIRAILRRRIDDESKARAIIRLASSGLAKHKLGSMQRIPYEVIMAHFVHPDAAAAYDVINDEILFPSPSAVRAMQRGEHRLIPDMVNTLAHEGTHAYLNQRYYLIAENDLDQIKLDTVDEAIASAMGDLAAHKLAGGPKPKKSYADWYISISETPLHREAFKHIYWTVAKNAKTVEDAAKIGIAAAKKFGIHVEPRDRI